MCVCFIKLCFSMRILWYTNTSCLYKQNNVYNGGGWLSSLQALLMKHSDIELGIAFELKGENKKVVEDKVIYYPMSFPGSSLSDKVKGVFCSEKVFVDMERRRFPLYEQVLRQPFEDFKPDIIMVFGSEKPFGLVAALTDVPVVLHIQGILNPCLNAFLPPFVSWSEFLKSANGIKDWLRRKMVQKQWLASCEREKEIFRRVKNYFGRTDWDYRVCQMMNPQANYQYSSEALRPIFYLPSERQLPNKLTIVTTISNPLYKGYDLVLKTAEMLTERGIDFTWKCYGNIEPSVVENQLGIKHREVNIKLCGVASSEELHDALCHATAYVHTSYIDNSPNSLCEAQILGCTPIATNVGGIPSLIKNDETGYLIPANDPYQLAFLLEELFFHPDMNLEMGEAAKKVAMDRHNPDAIVNKLLSDLTSLIK